MLGFPYAVVRKYLDDGGAREAALITYYGFLSLFPLLLLGVAVLTQVLAGRPELRAELIGAIVPPSLRSGVDAAVAELPTSVAPLAVGLGTLLYTGAGVVFSAYRTLNHVAAVPFRARHGVLSWLSRVLAALLITLAGLAAAALAPAPAGALVAAATLVAVAKILLARPAPLR
ncbi:YhjD/YihY/BrkB family envelope integrity protein, partial [Actinoplanes sp. NPDC049596]